VHEDESRLLPAVVIESVLLIATVASFISLTAKGDYLWLAITLSAAALTSQVWLIFQAWKYKIFNFKNEEDPKFVKFFSDWYSQPGDHYIFCNDLDWLDNARVATVRQTLTDLGGRLTVYLVRQTGRACAEISQHGGKVVTIPDNLITDLPPKMSLVRDNESSQIILRRKQAKVDHVRFIRTQEPHLLCLANTIINACRDGSE